MPATKEQIKAWLRQVETPPQFLLIGPHDAIIATVLSGFGVTVLDALPGIAHFVDAALERARRVPANIPLGIALTAGLYPRDATTLRDALDRLDGPRILRLFDGGSPSADVLLDWLSETIAHSTPKASSRMPKEKDARDPKHQHGIPPGANTLVEKICELGTVGRVNFWKAKGRENNVTCDGEYVKVHLPNRYGLLVAPTCTHPVHLEALRAEIALLVAG